MEGAKEQDPTKKTDDWAEMSDEAEDPEQEAGADGEAKNHVIKQAKKKIPPTQKGTKNKQGDYVVTTIDIPDIRTGVKKEGEEKEETESDSDTEYDDEDDQNEAPAKEEEKADGKSDSDSQRILFPPCAFWSVF